MLPAPILATELDHQHRTRRGPARREYLQPVSQHDAANPQGPAGRPRCAQAHALIGLDGRHHRGMGGWAWRDVMPGGLGGGRDTPGMVIFDDLQAEQDRLENILAGLDEAQWAFASGAPGWTVVDVVLHLAQTEEAVAASVAGLSPAVRTVSGPTLDQVMDQLVQAERAAPAPGFQ